MVFEVDLSNTVSASNNVAEIAVVTHLGLGSSVNGLFGVKVGTSGLAALGKVT